MVSRMIFKAILGLVILLAGHFAVDAIRAGYSFGKVIAPDRDISSTSMSLDGWSGRDLPTDERLRLVLCAKAGIDRSYLDSAGNQVLVHAVWTDDYLRIHFPEQCYRESGWELTSSKVVDIRTPSGKTLPTKILQFNRGGQAIQVLFWFELGDEFFLDRWQHRAVRRSVCWGKKNWPPLMKFMLETTDTAPQACEARLVDLAGKLHDECHSTSGLDSPVDEAP